MEEVVPEAMETVHEQNANVNDSKHIEAQADEPEDHVSVKTGDGHSDGMGKGGDEAEPKPAKSLSEGWCREDRFSCLHFARGLRS